MIVVKVEHETTASHHMSYRVVGTAEARKGAEDWVKEYVKVPDGAEVVIEVEIEVEVREMAKGIGCRII